MSDTFASWSLDGLVAVGGLGEVWRARRGEKIAALKRLHTHLTRNDDARAQFALEQRLTMTLPLHPNLVHALEAGEIADRPFVVLELAAGTDLRRALGEHRVVPRASAIAIVAAASDATAHLHAHGWIHGDINPGNLVADLDDAAHVVLIDLNVAREIGAPASTVRGTHAYMAPEQVRGEAWTPATDVFALGVVLWELVAGARLFHRGPPWLSMAAVVEAEVPPLADAALDAIARAALAKDPHARLGDAAELARLLRATS
jgi:serine/threonine protein kinase